MTDPGHGPLFITSQTDLLPDGTLAATDVFHQIEAHVGI